MTNMALSGRLIRNFFKINYSSRSSSTSKSTFRAVCFGNDFGGQNQENYFGDNFGGRKKYHNESAIDIGDVRFRTAKSIDPKKIVHFVTDRFLIDEPITCSLNLSRNDLLDLIRNVVNNGLKSDASFVCVNKDDQLIGSCIAGVNNLENNTIAASKQIFGDLDIGFDSTSHYSEDALKIVRFLNALSTDLKQHLPDCKLALKLMLVAIDPGFKGHDLAGNLTYMCMARGRKLGCQYCYTEATAFASQRVLEKLGFKTVKIIMHEDYLDKDNKRIFMCRDNTNCGKLMILKL